MKEYKNVVFRRPKDAGITPVWDKNCKVLMLGSITATDGMNKGFYYASNKNQLWQLLDIVLNTNCFSALKEKLKTNFEDFKTNKISQAEFEQNREQIRSQFSVELLKRKIAICDVFCECYFNNNSSMDIDIILNNKDFPFKTSKEILQNIIDNSQIKTIVVNSKFVESQLRKMKLSGDFEVKYVISPSPRRGSIDKKIENWKQVFSLLKDI